MNGFSNRVVVHHQIAADRMYDDVAGIHSDAQGDVARPLAIQFVDASPHGDRGAASLNGMIFSGYGGSEESHDAVTTGLVHETIVLMDRVHKNLKYRSEYFERLFRIEFVDQRCRPADIGE
jgi:hypothetical protein